MRKTNNNNNNNNNNNDNNNNGSSNPSQKQDFELINKKKNSLSSGFCRSGRSLSGNNRK